MNAYNVIIQNYMHPLWTSSTMCNLMRGRKNDLPKEAFFTTYKFLIQTLKEEVKAGIPVKFEFGNSRYIRTTLLKMSGCQEIEARVKITSFFLFRQLREKLKDFD